MSLNNPLQTEQEPLESAQIEEKVLELLKLEIIDLQDYCDDCIPDNYPRFQVRREHRSIGTISTWGNKYCTQIIPSLGGYSSLYAAATCWVDSERLKQLESLASVTLRRKRSLMFDYF